MTNRIYELTDQLNAASAAYYIQHKQIMSDAEYDKLFRELVELELAHPDLISPNSPTQRVGSDLDSNFEKVEHTTPILSLANAFSEDDLKNWQTRNANMAHPPTMSTVIGSKALGYTVQPKLDGLTIVVTYKDGMLTQAATRGDGQFGDLITNNAKTIRDLPVSLSGNYPPYLVVRGEVVIHKDDFEKYNTGGEYANPRNLASGSIKQKKSSEASKRPLRCYVFDVMDWGDYTPPQSHWHVMEMLNDWGFHTPTTEYYDSVGEIIKVLDHWNTYRKGLPYNTDGIVIRVNNIRYFQSLGNVGKDPRGGIAYKWAGEQVITVLENIVVTVGRTGVLIPNAVLNPIQVGGVTVSRASLHNWEFIESLDLRIGDTVIVERAGDVIPAIRGVSDEFPRGNKTTTPPLICPYCKSDVVKIGAKHFCSNTKCPEKNARLIEFFVSKGGLDIKGVGVNIIRSLIDRKIVKSIDDLFNLNGKIDYLGVNQSVSVENAILESVGKTTWGKLLASLGIEGVGDGLAKNIEKSPLMANGIWSLMDFAVEKTLADQNIPGLGATTAACIETWFSNQDNISLIKNLETIGFNMYPDKSSISVDLQTLAGMKFVVTGKMSVPRPDIEAMIEKHGGLVSSSVSKKTNYVVAGEHSGSKLDKALGLGVQVISEDELYMLMKQVVVDDEAIDI